MGPRQGSSHPPHSVSVPIFPRLSRSFLRRHRSPVSFAHRDLAPAYLLRRGGGDPLTPLYLSLQLSELRKVSRFHAFHRRDVADVKEDLDSFVDLIHDVCPKEMMSCEGLFVLTLEASNVTRPFQHHYREGTFRYELIPGQLHKFSGAVAELLGCGDHVDTLIRELARFVFGDPVLAHGEQYLDSHLSLLHI